MLYTTRTLDLEPDEAIELGLELIRAGQDLNAKHAKRTVSSIIKPCVTVKPEGTYVASRFTFVVQQSS